MVPESLKFSFQYQKCSNPGREHLAKCESARRGGLCSVTNPYSDKSFQYS